MDKQEIIDDQTEQISKLREKLEEKEQKLNRAHEALNEISSRLTRIGGPLNDSKHDYSAEQRKPFHQIESLCSGVLREERVKNG